MWRIPSMSVTVSFLFPLLPGTANACDCAAPEHFYKWSEFTNVISQIADADVVIEGVPISDVRNRLSDDAEVGQLTFKTLRCVKGDCPRTLIVKGRGGDPGETCGGLGSLQIAWENKKPAWVGGYQDPKTKAVWVNACGGFIVESGREK